MGLMLCDFCRGCGLLGYTVCPVCLGNLLISEDHPALTITGTPTGGTCTFWEGAEEISAEEFAAKTFDCLARTDDGRLDDLPVEEFAALWRDNGGEA